MTIWEAKRYFHQGVVALGMNEHPRTRSLRRNNAKHGFREFHTARRTIQGYEAMTGVTAAARTCSVPLVSAAPGIRFIVTEW